MRRSLIKAVVGLVALGVLGLVFVRSALNTQAEPYEVSRDRLARWTLVIDPESSRSGVVALRPPPEFTPPLFSKVFTRSGESLSGPAPAEMPLVLKKEFDEAVAATITPETLLALARSSGLESATLEPRCMAHRRVSQPGMTRQVFFVRFAWPAFGTYRQQILQRLRDAGKTDSTFDPAALSPILIVAASDAAFSSWLPLRLEAADDCLAPIVVR